MSQYSLDSHRSQPRQHKLANDQQVDVQTGKAEMAGILSGAYYGRKEDMVEKQRAYEVRKPNFIESNKRMMGKQSAVPKTAKSEGLSNTGSAWNSTLGNSMKGNYPERKTPAGALPPQPRWMREAIMAVTGEKPQRAPKTRLEKTFETTPRGPSNHNPSPAHIAFLTEQKKAIERSLDGRSQYSSSTRRTGSRAAGSQYAGSQYAGSQYAGSQYAGSQAAPSVRSAKPTPRAGGSGTKMMRVPSRGAPAGERELGGYTPRMTEDWVSAHAAPSTRSIGGGGYYDGRQYDNLVNDPPAGYNVMRGNYLDENGDIIDTNADRDFNPSLYNAQGSDTVRVTVNPSRVHPGNIYRS